MSLRIRNVAITIVTAAGRYGTLLTFTDGLNVISAPNSSGKSTCMMSILYALGLEGMLGPSQLPPFPDAMRTSIMIRPDTEIPVVESFVRLEVENGHHQRITLKRLVTGTNMQRQLIRCEMGPALSQPSNSYERRDFYVRVGGAASEESGFHRFLAEFIGFDLPRVPAIEDQSIPLYLECLIPYFFVDQLSGWRDIKARMPTYLRVPEMAKRSAEYILDLDILHRAIEKQKYELKEAELKTAWQRASDQAKKEIGKSLLVVRGIPNEPTATWPPSPVPQLLLTDGQDWIVLDLALKNLRERQQHLVEEDIPRAEEVSQQAIIQLQEAEEELNRLTKRLELATRDLMSERANVDALMKRLRALVEDYRKYQDAKKVQDRDGEVPLKAATGICPTCNQDIKDALLRQERASVPMSLEENIAFIKDQIDTFRDMHGDAKDVADAKAKQTDAIKRRITDVSDRIRALKKTLHSDGRVPSVAAVQEHVQIDNRVNMLVEVESQFETFIQRFKELSDEWTQVQSKLKSLARVGLSENDEKKLRFWESSFIVQLRDYNFLSLPIDQLSLSRESYKPSRLGYEVGLTSASDAIRMIWAFLIGMLDTARHFPTNHLGFLVFDEPRQQGTESLSFDALLKTAADSEKSGQQIIVATSEDKLTLGAILADLKCTFRGFDGKILQKLPE